MRRNGRGIYEDTDNYKAVLWVAGGILLAAIIAFFVVYGIYNSKIEEQQLALENEESSKIDISNSVSNATAVSSSIGKNVNEVKNEMNKNESSNQVENNVSNENVLTTVNENVIENTEDKSNAENTNTEASSVTTTQNTEKEDEAVETVEEPKEEEKEPAFVNPIENGEVLREFAKDNLVYSDTLEEWITHLGLDIKAPKTTVVKAAEAGTVESIKNDPRYGLTVIIKHSSNYKTVYSNLLTAEFVKEGDEIVQGQTIGTVGNTAAFEIADEPHLHFEIIKNGEKVDPSLYII